MLHRIFIEFLKKEEIDSVARIFPPTFLSNDLPKPKEKKPKEKEKKIKEGKEKIIEKNPTLRPETSNLSRYV